MLAMLFAPLEPLLCPAVSSRRLTTGYISRAPMPSELPAEDLKAKGIKMEGIFLHFLPSYLFSPAVSIFIHSYGFYLVGPLAAPSRWQRNTPPALSHRRRGSLLPLLDSGSYHLPLGSLNHDPHPGPFIKISLLDHPRGFVTPARIQTDTIVKELRTAFGIWKMLHKWSYYYNIMIVISF